MTPAGGNASRWSRGLPRFLLVVFSAEIGLFLVLFPWARQWGQNYLSGSSEGWYSIWMNSYFRGAISGLGVLNLYIALVEMWRLLRAFRQ